MKQIPVFFTPKMIAKDASYSPSAAKPAAVVASWRTQFPIEIIEPSPVGLEELSRAHDRAWVEAVLACQQVNGFGTKSKSIADALPYTSGSMLSAALHVLHHGGAAAAPCSGFHHAEYARAKGFCTFNGLMVTVCALKEAGVQKIGIIDLDMHYGDGTDNIIRKLDAGGLVKHFTGGAEFHPDPSGQSAMEFFAVRLPEVLESMRDREIILYQAGADPHVDDPQGGWLTTDQLRMRDSEVFTYLAQHKIPVAWNLAGGYQRDKDGNIPAVLEIHDNTMRECVKAYVR